MSATILEKFGHGGDLLTAAETFGIDPERIVDFSANINPLGPPPSVTRSLKERLTAVAHYPDPAHRSFRKALARRLGTSEDELLIGNGAAECMALALLAFAPRRVGVAYPCFSEYAQLAEQFGAEEIRGVFGREELHFQPDLDEMLALVEWADLVFIGHPNNPTGVAYRRDEIIALAEAARESKTYLVVDEAFLDFLPETEQVSLLDQLERFPTTILIRSMTKMYAIPGLRLGYAIADAALIEQMKQKQVTWSVNALALIAGEQCLAASDYVQRTRALVREQRDRLKTTIEREWGWRVYPGRANFLLVRLDEGAAAKPLQDWLLKRGILIRNCSMYPGLGPRHFRIAVLDEEKNDKLLRALAAYAKEREET